MQQTNNNNNNNNESNNNMVVSSSLILSVAVFCSVFAGPHRAGRSAAGASCFPGLPASAIMHGAVEEAFPCHYVSGMARDASEMTSPDQIKKRKKWKSEKKKPRGSI